MPLPPQRHHPAGNHALTNADQTVTKVDTRLTKLTIVNPRSNRKPQQNTAQSQPHPLPQRPQRQPPLSTPPAHPEQP